MKHGVSSDSVVAQQVAETQDMLEQIFARLQGGLESLQTGIESLPKLSALQEQKVPIVESQQKEEEKEQMSIDLNDIVPGLDESKIREISRELLKHLPQTQAVTPGQEELSRLDDANLDPKIKAQIMERQQREAASAPPSLDPKTLEGKTDAQKNEIVTAYVLARDSYFQSLMERPAGTGMTTTESKSLAGEALRALRDSGMRIS